MESLKFDTPKQTVYSIAPAAGWIRRNEFDAAQASKHPDSPWFYLLIDYQLRVVDGEIHRYCHTVEKINDASRLEDASQFLSDFEAAGEHMVIHGFEIVRGGQPLPALAEDNIEVYRRETQLEAHITDNRLTLAVSLDDLRVGDLLEIRTTRIQYATEHPLHAKQLRATYWLGWSCPVQRQLVRVVNHGSLALNLHQHLLNGGAQTDRVDTLPAGREFAREYLEMEPKAAPDNAPAWLWSDFLQITSRSSWTWISRYLHRYYTDAGVLGAPLDLGRIERIRLGGDMRADILRLVRFVQNEIRYRGENQGIYTHTPKAPQKVLARGAGDCKDKSALLVALLKTIGAEANLALVNTRYGTGLDRFEPSAYHFNHMIVRVDVDGVACYFDPTVRKQAGDFEHAAQLDYGYALNLTGDGEELATIPFDVDRMVFEKSCRLDLRQVHRGEATISIERKLHAHRADNLRYNFGANDSATIRRDYLDWARGETDLDLVIVEPVSIVEDDLETNTVITREEYRILNPEGANDGDPIYLTNDFGDDFPLPANNRFPVQTGADGAQRFDIEVWYRHPPDIEATGVAIDGKHFEYRDRVWCEDEVLHFSNLLIPRRRLVEVRDLEAYRADVTRMAERNANVIARDVSEPVSSVWGWLGVMMMLAAMLVMSILRRH